MIDILNTRTKPIYGQAVLLEKDNIDEVAQWAKLRVGEVNEMREGLTYTTYVQFTYRNNSFVTTVGNYIWVDPEGQPWPISFTEFHQTLEVIDDAPTE